MRTWETSLIRFMNTSYPDIGKDIADKNVIEEETEIKLRTALDAFTSTWQ